MTQQQEIINELCVKKHDDALKEYEQQWPYLNSCRSRTCSATIFETENYYLLMSYATIIACIDKYSGTCYDYLRYVYGYTNTSAQHIRKFMNEYNSFQKLTWHN